MDEQERFDQLVTTCSERVRGYFWHAWRFSETEIDDLTQETFVMAWRGLSGFRGESTLLWWVLQIARRIAWRYVKKRQMRSFFGLRSSPPLEHEATDERLVSTLETRSEIRALASVMKMLVPAQRELIHLHYMQGFTESEMAEFLGINRHTLHTQLNNARTRLHTLFQRHTR